MNPLLELKGRIKEAFPTVRTKFENFPVDKIRGYWTLDVFAGERHAFVIQKTISSSFEFSDLQNPESALPFIGPDFVTNSIDEILERMKKVLS